MYLHHAGYEIMVDTSALHGELYEAADKEVVENYSTHLAAYFLQGLSHSSNHTIAATTSADYHRGLKTHPQPVLHDAVQEHIVRARSALFLQSTAKTSFGHRRQLPNYAIHVLKAT